MKSNDRLLVQVERSNLFPSHCVLAPRHALLCSSPGEPQCIKSQLMAKCNSNSTDLSKATQSVSQIKKNPSAFPSKCYPSIIKRTSLFHYQIKTACNIVISLRSLREMKKKLNVFSLHNMQIQSSWQ